MDDLLDYGYNALTVGGDGALYFGTGYYVRYPPHYELYTGGELLRLDGTAWTRLAFGAVWSLAPAPNGGIYLSTPTGVRLWNRTTLTTVGATDSHVRVVVVGPDGSLYAGGSFTTIGGVAANGVARWNGSAWTPLGSGIGGDYPSVRTLAVGPDGSLYAGGSFTTIGGVTVDHVGRWDGTAWHAVGGGVRCSGCGPTYVYALAFVDSVLYAGGRFTEAGGIPAHSLAQWDGTAWTPLGVGVDSDVVSAEATVYALARRTDGNLVLGGYFDSAGGARAASIALYQIADTVQGGPPSAPQEEPGEPSGPTPPISLSAPRPNPTAGRATLALHLEAAEPVRAVLLDPLGRTVAVLLDGVPPENDAVLTVETGRLAPGVYTVRVAVATATASRRLTVIR